MMLLFCLQFVAEQWSGDRRLSERFCVYMHRNTALTDADNDSGRFTLGDGGQ